MLWYSIEISDTRRKRVNMYITKINDDCLNGSFNWETYFDNHEEEAILEDLNYREIFFNLRELIKEDKYSMNLSLTKLIKNLTKNTNITEPMILELGAATGLLTRMLISMYGGKGILVDNCEESHQRFIKTNSEVENRITYVIQDLFQLEIEQKFDIVCSFGLIEHFVDKKEVMNVHKKFLKKDGYLIVLIPLDSNLSRSFFEIHPELNLGYRELLNRTEFREILLESGFKILCIEKSYDYSYDYIAAICQLVDE